MFMLRVDIKLWLDLNQLRLKMQSFDVLLMSKTRPIILWEMAIALAPDPRLDIQTASHFLRISLDDQLYGKGVYFCSFVNKPIKHAPNIQQFLSDHHICRLFQLTLKKTFFFTPTPFTYPVIKALQTAETADLYFALPANKQDLRSETLLC